MVRKIGKHVFMVSVMLLAGVGALSLLAVAIVALLFPKQETASVESTERYEMFDETLEDRYLNLMKRCLTRYGLSREYEYIPLVAGFDNFLSSRRLIFALVKPPDSAARIDGSVARPSDAETMIGLKHLDNLQNCIVDVLKRDVPGDLIEAGAWRGGATIFMRAVLEAYGDTERNVWVADSFEGLPKPNEEAYPADAGDEHWRFAHLAVSVSQVRENFARYGLLDDRVRFLKGWFKDTLPSAPIEKLAVLRIDGDMYGSTMEVLRALYPKLSAGGYLIVDDYGAVPGCKKAVEDFRAENAIVEEMKQIDWTGVYWQKLN